MNNPAIRSFSHSVILLFSIFTLQAQETYNTSVNTNMINSLQVKVEGELISIPVIKMNSDERIEINFDLMDHNFNRFVYSVTHCDADWKQSSLSPLEYMNGFQGLPVEDFANSIATTTNYTNFRLLLPNDDVQFRVSGNYAVRIYDEDEPTKTLLTACFSIVEPMISIGTSVSSNTMIDTNREHQQVSFTINHRSLPIAYPQTDLKIFVQQNNRKDNMVTNLKPTTITNGQLAYDFNRDLIFPAGNEYRRFEFLSNRYNGMGVETMEYHNPYYHVVLHTDHPRANQTYRYDQDQNGRFFIRCSSCNDPDTEAEYNIVHFALETKPYPGGVVYLLSDIFSNRLNEKSKMGYNRETGCYELNLLLKQGNYNYQYVYVPNTERKAQTAPFEGNYYQTENQYTVYVYFRPIGTRYDRLIGVSTVKNDINVL